MSTKSDCMDLRTLELGEERNLGKFRDGGEKQLRMMITGVSE